MGHLVVVLAVLAVLAALPVMEVSGRGINRMLEQGLAVLQVLAVQGEVLVEV